MVFIEIELTFNVFNGSPWSSMIFNNNKANNNNTKNKAIKSNIQQIKQYTTVKQFKQQYKQLKNNTQHNTQPVKQLKQQYTTN